MHTQPSALPFTACHFSQVASSSFRDPFFRALSHQYPSVFSLPICASQTIHGPWTQSGGLQPTFSKQIRQDRTYQSRSHTVNVTKKKKEKNDCLVKPISVPYMSLLGLDGNLISYCGLELRFLALCLRWQIQMPQLSAEPILWPWAS